MAQYGGGLGKNTNYRVFAKYLNQDHLPAAGGAVGFDGWHLLRGGFRTDSHLSRKDNLTVEGDLYTGQENSPATFLPSVTSPGLQNIDAEVPLSGGFLSSTWDHAVSARSDTRLQISFDRYKRDDILTEAATHRSLLSSSTTSSGATVKTLSGEAVTGYTASDTRGNLTASFSPPDFKYADIQCVLPGRGCFGAEQAVRHTRHQGGTQPVHRVQPGCRAHVCPGHPVQRQMFWAAISRAERTPAESDTSVRANVGGFPGPGGTPVLLAFVGNPNFEE